MTAFYEELVVGEREVVGTYLFTAEEIKTFAKAYDPQAFHLDEAAAAASPFGGLCASGWHTAGIWMRLMVQHRAREAAARAARGLGSAVMGPSPGFKDLRWSLPVYAGDTVTFDSTLQEKRESGSRPGWGLVRHLNGGSNQAGERVFSFTSTAFWQMRGATA